MHNILHLDPLIYCHKSCDSGCCQVDSVRRKANIGPGNVDAATPRDRLDPAAQLTASGRAEGIRASIPASGKQPLFHLRRLAPA